MNMIDDLDTRGGTDIFGAIEKGINLVVNREDKSRNP